MIVWTSESAWTTDPELVEYVEQLDEFYLTAEDWGDPIQLHDGGHNIVQPDGDRIGSVFAFSEEGTRVELWYLDDVLVAQSAVSEPTFSVVQTSEVDSLTAFLEVLGSGYFRRTEVRYRYKQLVSVPNVDGHDGTGLLYRVCQTYVQPGPVFSQPSKTATCTNADAKAWLLREELGTDTYDHWVFAPGFDTEKTGVGSATLTFTPHWADIEDVRDFYQWGIDTKGATLFTRYHWQEEVVEVP